MIVMDVVINNTYPGHWQVFICLPSCSGIFTSPVLMTYLLVTTQTFTSDIQYTTWFVVLLVDGSWMNAALGHSDKLG